MRPPSCLETLRSPPEMPSRSVSPLVPKPAAQAPPPKQRLSSMNSVGSAHLAHQRSMSIVSLESPRNSIVSVEDFFVKPTRNNSSSSLASLGVAGSPLDLPRDAGMAAPRLAKPKPRGCAIASDDESSEPEHLLARSFAWRRRRSSDKVHKPDFFLSFKNNFKFKCDSHKPKAPPSAAKLEDLMPSPLSAAVDACSHHAPSLFGSLDGDSLPPPARPPLTPTAKKVRSSSMTQSMFLKRKLLLSKDIQLELLSSHAATTAAYPGHGSSHPVEVRAPSHFLAQLAPYGAAPQLPSPPHAPPALHPSAAAAPALPPEQTLHQKNRLISELNRKWNRAMYVPALDDYAAPDMVSVDLPARRMKKRGRSDLSSSADSVATSN